MKVRECEDCGDEVAYRRYRCPHLGCKLLLCGVCWTHEHGCWPTHTKATCWDIHPELRPPTLHYHTEERPGRLTKLTHCLDADCQRERYTVADLEQYERDMDLVA